MGLRVTLAGQDITSSVQEATIQIQDTLAQGAGAAGPAGTGRAKRGQLLTSLGPAATAVGAGSTISSPQLVRGGEIIIYDASNTKIFGGFVGKIEDKTEKKTVYTQLDFYDYFQELNRIQVQKVYSGMTDVQMIKDLLTTYAPWVDQSALPTLGGYLFTAKVFKATTLQQALTKITDVTNYVIWIDPYKKAHYLAPTSGSSSPFSLADSPDFVNTFPHAVEEFTIDDISAINRVTFFGGKIPSNDFTQDLSTQANASNLLFVLAYYPRNASDGVIHVKSSNLNGGKDLTLGYELGTGTQNQFKSDGGNCDVLLNADAHTLKFDPGAAAPVNSGPGSVACTYRYEHPLVVQITDQTAVQYYGRYYDGVISDDTVFDIPVAVGRAKTLLLEQSRGLITLKVHCYKSGVQAGQIIKVVNSVRGINASYIVQEVDYVPLGAGNFQYTLQLGAWRWNLVDVIKNTAQAAFQAGISTDSSDNGQSGNILNIQPDTENMTVSDSWAKTTRTPGVYYARATAVGDGHDSYPGLSTIGS